MRAACSFDVARLLWFDCMAIVACRYTRSADQVKPSCRRASLRSAATFVKLEPTTILRVTGAPLCDVLGQVVAVPGCTCHDGNRLCHINIASAAVAVIVQGASTPAPASSFRNLTELS